MKVRDIMHSATIIMPHVSVSEAAKIMAEKNIGSILIGDYNKNGIGIITERDILKKIVAKGLDPSVIMVEDVMTRELITVDHDTNIEKANKIFREKNIRRLPVTENGKIIGMVTTRDATKSLNYFTLRRKLEYDREIDKTNYLIPMR
jgi:CBS domain-containing protein